MTIYMIVRESEGRGERGRDEARDFRSVCVCVIREAGARGKDWKSLGRDSV